MTSMACGFGVVKPCLAKQDESGSNDNCALVSLSESKVNKPVRAELLFLL